MHEFKEYLIEEANFKKNESDSRNSAGKIASVTVANSIAGGAAICAGLGDGAWKRATYVNPYTSEAGFVHQILSGKPGTKWNKFYHIISGINTTSRL